MKILVAGGAGYVGSKLVPTLLASGHEIVVLDLYLYGEGVFQAFKGNSKLTEIRGDIRDIEHVKLALQGCNAVIHLACISNDPSFELDPELGKSINLDSFEPFVKAAKTALVERFIYASSSSVYGVKEEPDVNEGMTLEPLTDYSKFKAKCEKILLEHADDIFTCTVIRPATVCGYAPRQRLDVIVNILTNLAYNTGKIKIMGGDQMRPNIHIDDMVRAYMHVLNCPKESIQKEVFNVGYHNHTVKEIAEIVRKVVSVKRDVIVETIPTNDPRSYHISSKRIAEKINFLPKHTIEDAVVSLVTAFEENKLPNSLTDEVYFNIKTMQKVKLK